MLKRLFIQIPAFNEEDSVLEVLKELPAHIPGIDAVEIVVINDGSTDKTVEIVRAHGPSVHVLDLPFNQGLGTAFRKGLAYALAHGADIIVNTDADRQYVMRHIEEAIVPVLRGDADIVIGDRQLGKISGYPMHKLISQSMGNLFLSVLYFFPVRDATSGFRVLNRAASQLLVEQLSNQYTYTIESLCLMLKKRLRVMFMPITIRYPTRRSRLIKSRRVYMNNFIKTAIRMRLMHHDKRP